MKSRFEQGLLKHLAAVAIAFGAGMAPASGLLEIPTRVLDEIVEGIEALDWDRRDRHRLLSLLAHDRRPEVRARVALKVATLWSEAPDQTEQLLRQLARDRSAAVRAASASGVEHVLESAPPLQRIALVAEWCTSTTTRDRAAIAAALRAMTPVFIGDLAIELLARDPDARVRHLALRAAAQRVHEAPRRYAHLAISAASDPERRVRRSARRLLEHARSVG